MKRRSGIINGNFHLRARHFSPKCLATPFTVKGVKWEIHNHDADINNPSCPHMHAIGKPWKLDLYTGIIYDERTGAYVGQIKPKELFEIWNAKGVLKIILAERAIYDELHKKDPIRYPALPELIVSGTKRNKTRQKNVFSRYSSVHTIRKDNSIIVEFGRKSLVERTRKHVFNRRIRF